MRIVNNNSHRYKLTEHNIVLHIISGLLLPVAIVFILVLNSSTFNLLFGFAALGVWMVFLYYIPQFTISIDKTTKQLHILYGNIFHKRVRQFDKEDIEKVIYHSGFKQTEVSFVIGFSINRQIEFIISGEDNIKLNVGTYGTVSKYKEVVEEMASILATQFEIVGDEGD